MGIGIVVSIAKWTACLHRTDCNSYRGSLVGSGLSSGIPVPKGAEIFVCSKCRPSRQALRRAIVGGGRIEGFVGFYEEGVPRGLGSPLRKLVVSLEEER